MRFVSLAQSGRHEVKELCEEFGISRKTGYKWLERFGEGGLEGLTDRSRAPKSIPHRTEREVEELIVGERRRHPSWGPKKLGAVLEKRHGIERAPAVSTIGEILKRNGLIEARRRRPGAFKVERKDLTEAERVNQVWAADFKGWFHTGDGDRCDPLTITDQYSRYVIKVSALPQATQRWTRLGFEDAFKRKGMPEIIRVDNGSPFGSIGPGGLSKLSAWWISLGIEVQFIRPGHPQDNGQHERMHRTMKLECCEPASENVAAQQRRFDRWRKEFNAERPHESLGQRYPSELYEASMRRWERDVTVELYGANEQTYAIDERGNLHVDGQRWAIGEAFIGHRVVLEESWEADSKPGCKGVRFANIRLGIIGDSPSGRLRPTASAARMGTPSCTQQKSRS